MNEISLKCFLNTFSESCKNEGRFCFILGAGASKESGIKTGMEMVKTWYEEIVNRYSELELKEIMAHVGINDIEVSKNIYFDMYDLRFYPNYKNGYAYIERLMENAQPSYGYYPLSMQLAKTNNNLVITTNFDCMVEDALFIYTEKRPIVIGHEYLASYININSKRPIIAKIHRGLYFEPFNRRKELNGLPENWIKVLRTAFQVFTPIVIGYAGGDNTLMEFFKDSTVEMNGLYWCYYKGDILSEEIKELVKSKNGYLVPIDGFDSMMFALSEMLLYDNPSDWITNTANRRIEIFDNKYKEFSQKMRSIGNPDESQSEVIDLIQTVNNRAIESEKNRLKKNPRNKASYIKLAKLYVANGEHSKAIDSFSRAINIQPNDALIYRYRGDCFLIMKDYIKAITDFNKAIELKIEHLESTYVNRGCTYVYMKEYDKAIEDFNKALGISPNLYLAYRNRGYTYGEIRKYEKAIEDLNKAVELKPDYEDAYDNRGYVYGQIKEYKKAIDDLNKAITLKPDFDEAYKDRGQVYTSMKEYEKAIEDFNKAIELKPDFEEAYNNRAIVYYKTKEFDKAITDLNKSIELKADYENSYYYLGLINYETSNYDEALKELDKTIMINPNYEEAYRARAEVYQMLGEKDKAKADIVKADLIMSIEKAKK